MREYLDKVVKSDQCAQHVDDIGIAANDADHLIANLRATFKCFQEAGLQLTMHKCYFGTTEIDFLGRTITPQGVKPQKQNVQNFLEKTKFPKSKKVLQRYLGCLNFYKNYVPRLSEHLAPFYKMLKSDEKVLVSTEMLQKFEEINKALDQCCDLGLQQPLPNKQVALMTDASFGAAGYATLIEDDPNPIFNSPRKSYAYYVIRFDFVIAHIPGAQNTAADYLSCLESDLKDKLLMKIREDVQTLPIEINVQSAGVSQKEIFHTNDNDETEEQFWARKEAIRRNSATAETTITIQSVSTNLVTQHPEIQVRLRKAKQILIEQSGDAVLQQLKVKLFHEEYSENVLQQDARYRHYANNSERIVVKEDILMRQYFDELGIVKYHQILLPQHLLQ